MNSFFYNLGRRTTSVVLSTKDMAIAAAEATGEAGSSFVQGCRDEYNAPVVVQGTAQQVA